jgi:DNA-binding PadR family transcriptional regulator
MQNILRSKKSANPTHSSTDAGVIDENVSPREELVLLALYGKELYGLQIPKAMEEASGGQRQMGIGSLYPTLHSLEKKHLIESRWGDEGREERGGARRRYYKLTDRGVATVNAIQSFRANLIAWQPV